MKLKQNLVLPCSLRLVSPCFFNRTTLSALASFVGLLTSAHAVDATWTGATDGDWNTATNWAAAVPTDGTATFNNSTNTAINLLTARSQFKLVFDTASVGSFTFSGQKFIAGGSGQSVTINANVTSSPVITFNNDFQTTTTARATNYDWGFANNSATAGLVFNAGVYANDVTATLGGRLNIGGAGTVALNGIVSDGVGPGMLLMKKTGNGTLTLGNANTHTGGVEFSGSLGTIILGNKAGLGAGALRIVGGAGTLLASADLSGANAIGNTINYVSVNNATTATLGLTLTAGSKVAVWNTGAVAPVIGEMVTAAGNLPFYTRVTGVTGTAGAGTVTFDLNAGLGGTVTGVTTAPHAGGGSGTTIFGGTNKMEFSGTQNLTTQWSTGAAATQTLNVTNTADTIFSGVLQQLGGTAGLTKTGAGRLILTNANTYTGTTTISAGTLQLGNGGTSGSLSTSGNLTNNANLTLNRSNTVTQGVDFNTAAITGTGSLTHAGAGTVILTAANTFTGGTTISSGTLQIGNNSTTGSLSNTDGIVNNGTLLFNRSAGLTTSSVISGTGALIQDNSTANYSIITVNAAGSSFSGTTTVRNGFLSVGPNSILSGVNGPLGGGTSAIVLGDPSTLASGYSGSGPNAVLQVTGVNDALVQDYTISRDLDSSTASNLAGRNNLQYVNGNVGAQGTLTVSGGWTLSGGNLRSNGLAAQQAGMSIDFTGAISGGNSATRFRINDYGQGVGKIRLSNSANSYASQTTVTGGTLLIAGNAAVASGVLGTNASLILAEGGNAALANTALIDGPYTVDKTIALQNGSAPASTWTLGGNQPAVSEFTGNVTTVANVNSRTLKLAQAAAGSVSFSGVISANTDAAAVTDIEKIGDGTVILSGANTYDGITTVTAGTLFANNTTGSATGAGAVAVSSGATLGGTGSISGVTTISTGAIIAPGASAGTLTIANNLIVDGIYACQLDGAANGDKLAVTGDLDIDGATLAVSTLGGGASGDYVIATYTGSLTGTLTISPALPAGYSVSYATPGQVKLVSGVVVTDYGTWASGFSLPIPGNGDPNVDADNDGLKNQQEYAFGLIPNSGSSVSPITSQLNKATGLFSYTRRKPSLTGLVYTYEYSTTLAGWTDFTPDSTSSNSGDPVEIITVDVPNALLGNTNLFVRVIAK